jgi:hypothetical protein
VGWVVGWSFGGLRCVWVGWVLGYEAVGGESGEADEGADLGEDVVLPFVGDPTEVVAELLVGIIT